MTTASNYVMWVAKHLEWFDFHTPEAQLLRRQIRSWMYGTQNADEAEKLQERFKSMFSDDVLVDIVYPLFRREMERQFILMIRRRQRAFLEGEPKCEITGRTIRAYGGPEESWANGKVFEKKLKFRLERDKNRIAYAAKQLQEDAMEERVWYKKNHMGAWTILCIVCFSLGVVGAVLLLVALLLPILTGGYMPDGISDAYDLLEGAFIAIPVGALGAVVLFFVKCKRFYYSLVASLLWFKEIKRENTARIKFLNQMKQKIQAGGLERVVERLYAAACELRKTEGACLGKKDPSSAYIGENGIRQLVQAPPPHICPNWEKRKRFLLLLSEKGIRKPFWYFAAGVTLLIMVFAVV